MENTPDKLAEQRAAHRRVQQAIEKKVSLCSIYTSSSSGKYE